MFKSWRIVARAIVLSLVAVLLLAAPILAFLYRAPIAITESNGTAYSMLPTMVLVNNQWMADNGFMNSSANDTRVQTLGGLNRPHMVADNVTLTAVPVPANSQTNLYFVTGESELSDMDIISGYGGYVTVADSGTLELGDNGEVLFVGYIDTSADSNKDIVYKQDAFRIYIQAAGSVRAAILSGGDTEDVAVTAAGVSSGVHTVLVTLDTSDLKIYIDGVEEDSAALGGNSVPDNNNDWILFRNDVAPYVGSFKIWN